MSWESGTGALRRYDGYREAAGSWKEPPGCPTLTDI
jgi:hypothetical protein